MALVEGLTERLAAATGRSGTELVGVTDLAALVNTLMNDLDAHRVEARAEALYNADPRRFSSATREHSRQFEQVVRAVAPK